MRIGDATTAASYSNGMGIKFHDAGNRHWSIGQLSGSFLISQTSDNGNNLFSPARIDAISIASSGNVSIGSSTTGDKLAVSGSLSVTGSLMPGSGDTYDIGTSAKHWNNIFANNISGSITGSGLVAGSVVFAAESGVLSGSNSQFFWDSSNNRLGIGTSSPTTTLTAWNSDTSSYVTTTQATPILSLRNNYGSAANTQAVIAYSTANYSSFWASGLVEHDGGAYTGAYVWQNRTGASTYAEQMRIDSTGNVGIGTTDTTGSKLTVNGSIITSGSILPAVSNTYNLGSASKLWNTIYTTTLSAVAATTVASTTSSTYTKTFSPGEAGKLTATKNIAAAGTATVSLSVANGAVLFDIMIVASEGGFSVAKKYTVATQYGENPVVFKIVDTGPYSGADFTVAFSKSDGATTLCTITNGDASLHNFAITLDVAATSVNSGAGTAVTIF